MSDFVAILPRDVITGILFRLPAKSVGQFRCVSKPWRSLLSSPQFVKAHLNFHIHEPENMVVATSFPAPHIITFTADRSSSSSYDGVARKVICPLFQQNARVGGACHGLVLLVNKRNSILLINPITFEAVKVRKFSLHLPGSSCIYGLGYDSFQDDYKIVRISYDYTDDEQKPCSSDDEHAETFVDIYNVKLKTWRRLANTHHNYDVRYNTPGVFLNGCLHWLADDVEINGPPVIAAFHLGREEFDKVPLPGVVDGDNFGFDKLAVLGGCLAVQVSPSRFPLEVWVMKEYGVQESWTKLTMSAPDEYTYARLFRLVWFLREEDEIVFTKCGNRLVAYNLKNGVWRDMVIAGNRVFLSDAMTLKESLVSPNYE